jgi:hypothetical protein
MQKSGGINQNGGTNGGTNRTFWSGYRVQFGSLYRNREIEQSPPTPTSSRAFLLDSYEAGTGAIGVAPEPSRDYSLESYDADDGEDGNLEVEPIVPPQVHGHGGARPQAKAFAASTAELTGQSKRDINRSVARAEAIGPDLLPLVPPQAVLGVYPILD